MKSIQQIRNTALMVLMLVTVILASHAATITVNSNITTNTTWTNDNIYVLTGIIYVTNNSTLTIDAGTIIKGDSITLGSLIITRGSKIMAIGTTSQPIVFTSAKPAGDRKRGDWGGLILLGYAAVNWPGDTGHVEGITPNPNTLYGGGANPNCGGGDCPDAHDNSGTLQYVRIEFPGIALAPNNEINGLTMGGVGDATTIDHIQVSYSNDDSYEWFGGTVNVKYLIAYDGIDDDFDTDIGYSGRGQFIVGVRDPNVADVSGSKTFESDNDPTGSTNTPQTSPVFANVTGLGGASVTINPLFKQSAHLRRNTNEKIYNSIMMGFPQGMLIDGSTTIANCAASSLVKNSYVQQQSSNYVAFTPFNSPDSAAATAQLNGSGNLYSTQYAGVLVNADFPVTDIHNLFPAAGNPLQAADNAVYGGDPFFSNVTYIGAFNPAGDTWADGWTNFDPENANYTGISSVVNNVYHIEVFPNPSSGTLQVRMKSEHGAGVKIQVMDLTGRILMEQASSIISGFNSVSLDVSAIQAGSYTLRILNSQTKEQGVTKFIKD